MPSNRSRHAEWRDRVLVTFHHYGFHTASVPPYVPVDDKLHGDILNVPGVTIAVRNNRGHLDLAAAMHEVEREAAAEGNHRFASVHLKAGYDTEEAYTVLPLRVFLEMLRELEPDSVAPAARELISV